MKKYYFCQNQYIYSKKLMIIIRVEKNDNIDKLLKKYKYRVYKSGQIEYLKERQQHEKKSSRMRKQKLKARYIQSKYQN